MVLIIGGPWDGRRIDVKPFKRYVLRVPVVPSTTVYITGSGTMVMHPATKAYLIQIGAIKTEA